MQLNELYQEIIIEHNNSPRNFREMSDSTSSAQGFNPMCGDKVIVYIKIDDNVISDISFQGQGCAISQASASLMSEALKGKTIDVAHVWFNNFHNMLTCENPQSLESLGKLEVLSGVKEFPARVKCATLAWHTLENALKNVNQ